MATSPAQSPPTPRSPRRSGRRKSHSSLDGMFSEEPASFNDSVRSLPCLSEVKEEPEKPQPDQLPLRAMTRSLRIAKRQLLLRSVEEPENNVDRMRDLILKMAVSDDSLSSSESFSTMPTTE